jgi:hypothetical protein
MSGIGALGLVVVTHGQFCRDGFEVTKEAARAVVGTGGEIELGARRAGRVVTTDERAVAGAESPEAANGERLPGCVLDEAGELIANRTQLLIVKQFVR